MNIYDMANDLANEIKQSDEYINYKNAREKINSNNDYKIQIAEFEKLRYEEQINKIKNGINNEIKIKQMQKLYANLIQIEEIKQYFDAELKFNILFGDINKILSDAVQDVIS